MSTGPPLPEVGPWAREKLERLRKYLSAYTTILRKKSFAGYVYVDALAGAGRSLLRAEGGNDEREVLDGSPRVALGIPFPFTRYVFVERNADRIRALGCLKQEFPSLRIKIERGDCNDYLRRLAEHPKVNWKRWRAIVFLDPFGMQVPWGTLAALAATGAIEVFLNLPVGMAIQRLLLRRWHRVTPELQQRLDAYFGDPGWLEAVYPPTETLFGPERSKAEDAAARLVQWYCGRLRSAFGCASPPYLVRNTRRGHLYFLIWAGPSTTGLRIARHVLGGGEQP